MSKRKIIEIDENLCNGCGECVPNCAEGAMQIIDGKAKLVADKFCDGLGACMGHCPEGALKIIERNADEFDEEAVEVLLKEQGRPSLKEHEAAQAAKDTPSAGGCPSSKMQSFTHSGLMNPCDTANVPREGQTSSALAQWPVQITLVPPDAPFLQGADLLMAADCTPFAYADFHKEFLAGRKLLVGCPKLDDQQAYVKKLTEMFQQSDIKSLTVVIMEVPCCGMFPRMIEQALKDAKSTLEMNVKIVGIKGEIKQ